MEPLFLGWGADGYLALAAGLSAPWTPVPRSEPDRRPGPGGSSGSGSEAPLAAGRALQKEWEQMLKKLNQAEQNELNICRTKTHFLRSGAQRTAFRNTVEINTYVYKLKSCYIVLGLGPGT